MTHFQKTLNCYENTSKAMAYLAFKADPNANEGVSFQQFCEGMDAIIAKRNLEKK